MWAPSTRADETSALVRHWQDAGTLGRAELVLIAVNLHGYYTALEALLERVARLLDEEVPTGPSWHLELLAQMETTVPGLRPALIPSEAVGDLHELRKFRRFFRNAYVLELDESRVRAHAERLIGVHPRVRASLEAFAEHLDRLIGELTAQ